MDHFDVVVEADVIDNLPSVPISARVFPSEHKVRCARNLIFH
jgi:hypothetical protein